LTLDATPQANLTPPVTLEIKKARSHERAFAISGEAKQADQAGFPLFKAKKSRNINRINYLTQEPRGTKRNVVEICGILEELRGAFAESGGILAASGGTLAQRWDGGGGVGLRRVGVTVLCGR
jgi:hypothetical protein